LAVGAGTVSAGLTVSDIDALPVPARESVTVRVTLNGDPLEEVGVQLMEAEFELTHPGGRLVQE
jgi:hypothetical protein